ncbi:MAG TPA: NAD(+)/NADH kinase [Rhodothermales bacterium]|nr:NAD(+)/NADH kinase [Rhodothermales bacterium]
MNWRIRMGQPEQALNAAAIAGARLRMKYGITGNTHKETLWRPVAQTVNWLHEHGLSFCLRADVATGLQNRRLVDPILCSEHTEEDLAGSVDVLLSFGGDGTLLNTAHEVGRRGTPILGVNIGRLGFLADIEVGHIQEAIRDLELGRFRTEQRMVLEARVQDGSQNASWALNDLVIERSGESKLLSIDVAVDGTHLNVYWADGLIIATPTGSTAYSLSTGGPIMAPGCGAMILTPVAPHMLTVRPLVLPDSAVIEAQVLNAHPHYVLAADGKSMEVNGNVKVIIRRADHTVNLLKLPGQHYFQTIRSKLMWGMRSFEPHGGQSESSRRE